MICSTAEYTFTLRSKSLQHHGVFGFQVLSAELDLPAKNGFWLKPRSESFQHKREFKSQSIFFFYKSLNHDLLLPRSLFIPAPALVWCLSPRSVCFSTLPPSLPPWADGKASGFRGWRNRSSLPPYSSEKDDDWSQKDRLHLSVPALMIVFTFSTHCCLVFKAHVILIPFPYGDGQLHKIKWIFTASPRVVNVKEKWIGSFNL